MLPRLKIFVAGSVPARRAAAAGDGAAGPEHPHGALLPARGPSAGRQGHGHQDRQRSVQPALCLKDHNFRTSFIT